MLKKLRCGLVSKDFRKLEFVKLKTEVRGTIND